MQKAGEISFLNPFGKMQWQKTTYASALLSCGSSWRYRKNSFISIINDINKIGSPKHSKYYDNLYQKHKLLSTYLNDAGAVGLLEKI